eukprot:EC688525.1.p1 GENE.EC688525.1~~EC688525.1.p1  ORF type:complete len:100 (-),score=15.55 EC688525.1:90-344(-)
MRNYEKPLKSLDAPKGDLQSAEPSQSVLEYESSHQIRSLQTQAPSLEEERAPLRRPAVQPPPPHAPGMDVFPSAKWKGVLHDSG